MEKTIQITLNQVEANLVLRSVEALQEELGFGIEDTDKLRDLSILWDRVFDTGRSAGFGAHPDAEGG